MTVDVSRAEPKKKRAAPDEICTSDRNRLPAATSGAPAATGSGCSMDSSISLALQADALAQQRDDL